MLHLTLNMKEAPIPPFRRKSSEISVPESSLHEKNGKKIQDRLLLKLNIKPHKNHKEHTNRPTTVSPSIYPPFKDLPQQEQPPPLPSVDRLKSIVKRHSAPEITFNHKKLSPSGIHVPVKDIIEELIYYELDKLDNNDDPQDNKVNDDPQDNKVKDSSNEEYHKYSDLKSFLKKNKSSNDINNKTIRLDDKTNIFFDTTQAKLMMEIQERLKKRNDLKANAEINAFEINNLLKVTDNHRNSDENINSDYYSIPIDEIQKLKLSKNDVAIEELYATVNKKKNLKTFENHVTIEELYATVNKKKKQKVNENNPSIEGLYATVNKNKIKKSLDRDNNSSSDSDFTVSESTWL